LTNLGFEIKAPKSKTAAWEIKAPDFRLDIEREVDIYEEISRIYGYANFKNNIAFISAQDNSAPRDEVYQFKNSLRSFSSALGLKEIISFSIDNDEELAKLGYKNPIKLANPLRSQENAMRPVLLTGMIKVCRHNLNRVAELSFDQAGLKLFEIANVYSRDDKSFSEAPAFSIGLCSGDNSFSRLKAFAQKIFIQYNVKNLEIKEEPIENFSNALKIYINSKFAGFLGKLDDDIQKAFELKEDLFYAQLDVRSLCQAKQSQEYCPFSAYPAVWRDISIVMKNESRFKEIEKIIKEKNKYLAGLRIMDTYKGKDIPQDSHAFTLRVIYQANEKTLTSQEVDAVHTSIRETLTSQSGIILR
jgi:phenylalanyl-tRNA synthetase beta chain